jgi:hypothetical protein
MTGWNSLRVRDIGVPPQAKRRRFGYNTVDMVNRPRLGKFAKRVAKGARSSKKRASLAKQVATIAKIQKLDHKVLKKAQEYADFSHNFAYNVPTMRAWGSQALIDPNSWSATLRQSNLTATSSEAKILSMKVNIQVSHPSAIASTLTWTMLFVSGKGDFTGTPRNEIDCLFTGAGMPLIFNNNNIKIHKKFVFRTKAASPGDSIAISKPQRSFTMSINRWLRRTPTLAIAADHNWKRMTAADFNMQEQIVFMLYVDAQDGVQWTTPIPYTLNTLFAVQQM